MTPLRGPNMWTYRPSLEIWIDLGELEDFPSNKLPGFYERLSSWLPTLIEHHCTIGERGGFLKRLRDGTWAGHILEHVALELQNLAGLPSGFGKTRETPVRGVYKIAIRAHQEQVTRTAILSAHAIVMAAINDTPCDVLGAVNELRELIDSHCLGPSTACIVAAADDRRIPALRLSEGNLVQLGYGIHQRRIWTAETDRTSAIADSISRDKNLTKSLLQSCGVPVPEGELVASVEEAWEVANDIGFPVVIKPLDGNHGRGVSTNLSERSEIEAAFAAAREESDNVLVERFILGNEHRLLVVGDKVVAVAMGSTVSVVGNGKSSVQALIDAQLNIDPRRGDNEEHPLNFVKIDTTVAAELRRQGMDGQTIVPAGQSVLIQRAGNVDCDVTDNLHPSVAAHAVLAAKVVGLDIAGIDLVAQDISRPLAEQGGAIVEVNAGPGLLMHLKPAQGQARPVGEAIVEHLFAQGEDGRIPVVGISGTNGKTEVARLIHCMLQLSGKYTGLACSDGMYLGSRLVEQGNRANWTAARRVLMNRLVQAAVLENDSAVLLGEGLVYDRCQVGIVTNMGEPDHLGDFYIEDAQAMFKAVRTQIDVVLPTGAGVLNADDPMVADMASLCDGEVIFFSLQASNPIVTAHLKEGGRAVFAQAGKIILAQGDQTTELVDLANVPLTMGGRIPLQVQNMLTALAAAWALGISLDVMRAGAGVFDYYQSDAPGRFTVLERSGQTYVLDDPHNADALKAVATALENFPCTARHAVFAIGADRRDIDLIEQGRILGNTFDRLTLTTDTSITHQRDLAHMQQALLTGLQQGSRCKVITQEPDRIKALTQSVEQLQDSELLFVQTEEEKNYDGCMTVSLVSQLVNKPIVEIT